MFFHVLQWTKRGRHGASTKELMHRLGHASPRAALRYQHAKAERDLAIAEGMDRLLMAALAEPGATVVNLSRASAEAAE